MTPSPPPTAVLEAFGVAGETLDRFTGGRGLTWRAGNVVLKPADDDEEAAWVADLSARLVEDGFRIARPIPSRTGAWIVSGWAAVTFVAGANDSSPARWPEILEVCRRFHGALRDVPAPSFFIRRTDPWSVGDRVAWGEAPLEFPFDVSRPLLERLASGLRPLDMPRQVVHGDMTGNVLFEPGAPPAVIDLSPYHRPADWALAGIAVDGIAWWSAPTSIVDDLHDVEELPQLMRRAAIYRLVTWDVMVATRHNREFDFAAEVAEFVPVVDLIESLG